jgi:DNA-binding response OmpR family regulator
VYIEDEVEMKVIVYGQEKTYKTLTASLKSEGMEIHKLGDDCYTLTNLDKEEIYSLAIVDSRSDNANKACRYIRGNWDIPIVLIVDSLQADWKWLKSIEADGYISDVKNERELSARSRAFLWRLVFRSGLQEKIPG